MVKLARTRTRRLRRVRGKILAAKNLPRLSVFRSNKYIYGQIIDDVAGQTLVAVGSKEAGNPASKTEQAGQLGQILGEKASKLKILRVVFDRGRFVYAGRVKAFAEGARKGGLVF